jgi:predicted RND superfamily exporter protein
MKWFEKAFGEWVVKSRWLIILFTILAAVTAASGVRLLSFSNDTRVFFSEENPQLQALESLENTYNKIDNVLFAIAPKNNNIFTRETLSAVEELTEAAWQIPYSSRVDSITNFQHTSAQGDDLIVEDLVQNSMELSVAAIEQIKQIAMSEPLLVNNSLSFAGHVTSVRVNILKPGKSLSEVEEVAAFARNLADDFRQKYPDIDIHLTGGVMLDNAFGEAGKKDMATLVPLMLLTLVVIVGLALRSYIGTFAAIVIILFSMITAMGLAGWLGIILTAASVNAPTIILTLAVADSVHILATVFQQMRSGKSKYTAVAESLRINLQPVFLTSITTAIGFLTMNFSDAPPFRDLGNIVAMGVMAAFFYSVFFLPALLAVLPLRTKTQLAENSRFSLERLADLVVNQRRVLFWGMGILIVILTAGMTRIELNDQFVKYFSERYDIRRATDFVEANLTGWDIIEYSLESGEAGGINDPVYLAKVDAFANWYRQQPNVVHVRTITDTMKRLNKNMHGDDDFYYRVPEQRDLAAQYLLLYEMSLPFGLDLNNQINVDKSATRMLVSLKPWY